MAGAESGGLPQSVPPRLFTGAPTSLFVLTRNLVRTWRALGSWQLLFRKGLGWLKASGPLWLVNKFFEQVPPVFGPRFSPFWNRWPGREGGLWCGPQRPQCLALHPRPLLQLDQYGLTGPCFCFYFKKFTQLPHLCPSTAFGDSIPNPL